MELKYMVVERRGELGELDDGNQTTLRRRIKDIRYDPGSFDGRLTLSPVEDGGPSYYNTFELSVNDKAEFDTYNLGEIYLLSLVKSNKTLS